jgi:hypothetical protein
MTTFLKRIPVTVTATVIVGALGLAVVLTRAGAETTPAPASAVPTYHAPSGPVLEPTGAADSAIRFARESGDSGELTMQLGKGTVAQAVAVMEHHSPATVSEPSGRCFPGLSCTETEVSQFKALMAAENNSPAYLVVLRGQKFSPLEHLMKGGKETSASVMSVVVDAHTGIRRSMTIGDPVIPSVNALDAPLALTAAPESLTAQNSRGGAEPPKKASGWLIGHVYVRHRAAIGWQVILRGRHSTLRVKTLAKGAFAFRNVVGRYTLAAQPPHGKPCGQRTLRVVRQKVTRAVIQCG